MAVIKDKTGQRFGRLVALNWVRKSGKGYWTCQCDCGTQKDILTTSLSGGKTQSCGCLQRDLFGKRNTKYKNPPKTPTWYSWRAMRTRCNDASRADYHRWGGRGITYDPRWDDYDAFVDDMGERPEGTELDRIDNDGNYEKSNCRWATRTVNINNTSKTVMLEVDGVTKPVSEWCRETGISSSALHRRIKAGDTGQDLFRATSPGTRDEDRVKIEFEGELLTLSDLADRYGLTYALVWQRYNTYGKRGADLVRPRRKDRKA